MSNFQQNCETCKESGRCDSNTCTKKPHETASENSQMSNLTGKDFKMAIVNALKGLKKTMLREIKEGMMTISHQIENISKEIHTNYRKRKPLWEAKVGKLPEVGS